MKINSALAIIVGSAIIAATYLYANRYQSIGSLPIGRYMAPAYINVITGEIITIAPEQLETEMLRDGSKIKPFKKYTLIQ